MTLTIKASRLDGTVQAPPSKSYTHRAFVLAALSGHGTVEGALGSADTRATRMGLAALGVGSQDEEGAVVFDGDLSGAAASVDAANSGTTLRILTAVASLRRGPVGLTGDASLHRRPMGPLLASLGQLGVRTASRHGRCPLRVEGPIRGGEAVVEAQDSSQFVTALLLAASAGQADVRVRLSSPPLSIPYLRITERMLADYDVRVSRAGDAFDVPGGQRPRSRSYRVPGDWSSAAFFLAAAAVTGGRVEVEGLDSEDAQGDRAVAEILRGFGCSVRVSAKSVVVEGAPTQPQDVDLGQTPDLFPVLCAVAAVAPGTSTFTGAPHLRIKESDRISAMRANLEAFGVSCEERPDGLRVDGGKDLTAAAVRSFDDHRIAQAGLLLALAADGASRLEDPHVLAVSYPNLLDALRSTGGRVDP